MAYIFRGFLKKNICLQVLLLINIFDFGFNFFIMVFILIIFNLVCGFLYSILSGTTLILSLS